MQRWVTKGARRMGGALVMGLLMMVAGVAGWGAQASAPTDEIECQNGTAGPYLCEKVDFLSYLSVQELGGTHDTKAANLWGWTDPLTGSRYVIFGTNEHTAFVDATDPVNPVYLGSLPTATTAADRYRDVKVYDHYAFIIADVPSQHGMQVFDLHKLRTVTSPPVTFAADATFDGFGNAHNLFINETTGYAYVTRITNPTLCNGSVYMVDVRDPLNPAFAGCYGDGGLASDAMCVVYDGPDSAYQGHELCLVASDDDILIADVTDKAAPVTLATLTYPDIARAHLAWLTPDHRYFVSADMNDEMMSGLNTRIFVWDFQNVEAPQLIGIYEGPSPASDHNVWIKEQYAYVGNFRAGVRILDTSAIASGTLTQAAYFDMVPADNNTGHTGGAWALYPYFDDSLLAVSETGDHQSGGGGLYLLRQTTEATAVTLRDLRTGDAAPVWPLALAGLALLGLGRALALRRR